MFVRCGCFVGRVSINGAEPDAVCALNAENS
jgi:hypothetical protein